MLAKHTVWHLAQCSLVLGWLNESCLACSVCPSHYDYVYGTYGTKTPRTDMRHGRVGSILSDPVYRGGPTLGEPGVITEGFITEGVVSEGVVSEGVISDEILYEGVIPGEPQRVLRSPLRTPLGSPGEIIIE